MVLVQAASVDRDLIVTRLLSHFAALTVLTLLAACGGPRPEAVAPSVAAPAGYEAVQDGEFLIPAVASHLFYEGAAKALVPYNGPDEPGSIVVDTFARRLYLVEEGGMAWRYAIAVGREGLSFRGNGVIGRKADWPSWQPTANMVRTRTGTGGPQPAEVRRMLSASSAAFVRDQAWVQARRSRLIEAEANLNRSFLEMARKP